jgi:RNA recognition motif-containing protein
MPAWGSIVTSLFSANQPVNFPPFRRKKERMDSKLYVGNLPFSMTEEDLRALFAQAGTVTGAMLIKDRETGRSKGFGFVEMGSAEDAQNGIQMFNDKDYQGRPLKVSVARPREEGGGGGRGFGGGGNRGFGGGGNRGGGYGNSRGGGNDNRRRDW